MRFSKRTVYVVVMVAAVSAVLMALTVNALGARSGGGGNDKGGGNDQGQATATARATDKGSGNTLLRSTLAPSVPGDPPFHGVGPGSVQWVLQRGEVRLKRNGEFRLRLRGLVIPSPPGDNTPGPVNTVNASLYCGEDTGPPPNTPAATTDQVPISRQGDADINTTITVPSMCLTPVILVHPNGSPGAYISLEGWR